MRVSRVSSLISCASVLGAAAATLTACSSSRRAQPIDTSAVFAPLDLPAPTSSRAIDGSPGPGYWQQNVDYVINAELDAKARRIDAVCTMRYVNNSPDALPVIWVGLEQNLFSKDSTGARLTPSGAARFGNRESFDGGFTFRSVRSAGRDLVMSVNDTIARIDLPEPVGPHGGSVEITFEYSFRIPPYGSDRMGIQTCEQGEIFQIAQWFPSACVYDDVRGWNTLAYLGQGEFYTNFGDFDVSLSVPREHIVAATGILVNEAEVLTPQQQERLAQARTSGKTIDIVSVDEVGRASSRPQGTGPLTWRFKAHNVRTFAWASSEAFRWDAASASLVDGASVLCQSYFPREASGGWRAQAAGGGSTQMLKNSIEHYTRTWYPYPYPVASNINGIVGGMEYPMIIFCGERADEKGLFGVTTHEIGHTWFPMLVNTDERRYAWMDEGFNTFINQYAASERYGSDPEAGDRGSAGFGRRNPSPLSQPIMTPADQVEPGLLGTLQYAKTSAGMMMLRDAVLGPDRFDEAFRAYIRRWAFKSPQPADFFRTMESSSGQDLRWFWRGWFYGTGVIDQAIVNVEQESLSAPNGTTTLGPASVVIENRGAMPMPAVVLMSLEDGSTIRHQVPVQAWSTRPTWAARIDTGGRRAVRVELDPDQALADVDRDNNMWKR